MKKKQFLSIKEVLFITEGYYKDEYENGKPDFIYIEAKVYNYNKSTEFYTLDSLKSETIVLMIDIEDLHLIFSSVIKNLKF